MIGFQLGHIVATPAALELLQSVGVQPITLIQRHARNDWGDIDPEDRGRNEFGLAHDERLMSVYNVAPDTAVWIITEADRSATTILLPSDY